MGKDFFKELETILNNLTNDVSKDKIFLDIVSSAVSEKKSKIEYLSNYLTTRVGSNIKFTNTEGSDGNNLFRLVVNDVETSIFFDEKALRLNNLSYIDIVISKITPLKHYCQIDSWSYINEKNECKNFTEQKEYNQTILDKIKFISGENIILANIKLKPFFETLEGFEENSEGEFVINKSDRIPIKVVFSSSNNEENTIYYYNTEKLNEYVGKEMVFYQKDFETNGKVSEFMTSLMKNNNFGCVEIINLDDGLFGIKNENVRMENGKQILITLKHSTDIEYIKAMVLLSEMFSNVVNVDVINPKQKYSYHSKLLNDFKKQFENDSNKVNYPHVNEGASSLN